MALGLPSPLPLPLAVGAITITPITLVILESGTVPVGHFLTRLASAHPCGSALKNPVFWAPVLGVVIAVVKFHMPVYVVKSMAILGAATEGTALFVTGLIVSAQRFHPELECRMGCLSQECDPARSLSCSGAAIGYAAGTDQIRSFAKRDSVRLLRHSLRRRFLNATPEVASSSLIASTVLGIFTLAGWIVVLSHLH